MPIRKVKGGFKIDNVTGISKTKDAAVKRLREIKANQARSGKGKQQDYANIILLLTNLTNSYYSYGYQQEIYLCSYITRGYDGTLFQGDCLDVFNFIPSESVHCGVTSPPYWGLRDYGVDGQFGLESTPEAYIEQLVKVFREFRRI